MEKHIQGRGIYLFTEIDIRRARGKGGALGKIVEWAQHKWAQRVNMIQRNPRPGCCEVRYLVVRVYLYRYVLGSLGVRCGMSRARHPSLSTVCLFGALAFSAKKYGGG